MTRRNRCIPITEKLRVTGGFSNLLFCCSICERDILDCWDRRFHSRNEWPICRYCERTWGRGLALDGSGSFADRRMAVQIEALASALSSIAHQSFYSAGSK